DKKKRNNYVFHILDEKVKERIEERQWHHSQKLKPMNQMIKGKKVYAELRFNQVDSPVELKKWVLGWGSAIEVVEPASFREEIEQEIQKIGRLYGMNVFRFKKTNQTIQNRN